MKTYDLNELSRLEDPFPKMEEWRKEGGVLNSENGSVIVLNFQDCKNLLKMEQIGFVNPEANFDEKWIHLIEDKQHLSQFKVFEKVKNFTANSIARKDGDEHTRLKKIFLNSFRKSAIEEINEFIEKTSESILQNLSKKKEFDAVSELAVPLSNAVIMYIMGYKGGDIDDYYILSEKLLLSLQLRPSKKEKKEGMLSVIKWTKVLSSFLKNPEQLNENGLISILIKELQKKNISEDEFLSNAALLIMAGQETTKNLISSTIYYTLLNNLNFSKNSDQIINETLRFQPPSPYITKFIKEDVNYKGYTLPKGKKIHFLLAAANRDPSKYIDPMNFIFERQNQENLSFGVGHHYCIGSFLSLSETKIIVRQLTQKFENLKLKRNQPNWKKTIRIRGLET